MVISKTYDTFLEFNEIGEFHDFSIEVPLRGWDQLTSISLTATGITGTRFLDILVSYTLDGLNYSEFEPLSATINAPIRSDFIVIVRLIRAGSDNMGQIVLNEVILNGNYTQSHYDVFDLSNTMFSGILYEDVRWNKLWLNLLRKMYKEGIVPSFIARGADEYPADQHYIQYWKYQCMFWALTVELAYRKIEDLRLNRSDLLEFLKQKTLFFCDAEVTLEQLQYVMENLWDELRQRGTHLIHYRANVPLGGGVPTYVIPTDIEKEVDGELLRYLCYDILKEYVFAYYPRHLSGWTLDLTSPNYFCYTEQIQLNKAPEFTPDFLGLDGFSVYNPTATYLDVIKDHLIITEDDLFFLTTEDDNPIVIESPSYAALFVGASGVSVTDLLELEASAGNDFFQLETAGGLIALETGSLVDDLGLVGNGVKFGTVVDHKLGYECTMWVYAPSGDFGPCQSFSIWVKAYKEGGTVQVGLMRADGQIPLTMEANVLFNEGPLQNDKMWFLRWTIDPSNDTVLPEDVPTNWGVGNNLRFYDTGTDYIEVFILNQGDQDFLVWDLKFRPFKFENTYGLDNYNTTVLLSHLNNTQVTEAKFVDDVTQYLLPYGGGFHFLNLAKEAEEFNLLTELGEPIDAENDLNLLI
jgi:hypothetical protein